MTKFFARFWAEPSRVCGRKWLVYVAELVRLWGSLCLVCGADFGSTVSTGAFMLLVKKVPRLCIFERTVPPLCAQKWSAS